MKVLVLVPVNNSFYSLAVLERCKNDPEIELLGVLQRKILCPKRIKTELKRDGIRLLKKVWLKFFCGDKVSTSPNGMTLPKLNTELNITTRSVRRWAATSKIERKVVANYNEEKALRFIKKLKPDMVIFTGGGLIRSEFLDNSGLGVLNIHLGILPEYRGMDVIEWPILIENSLENIGMTGHLMNKGLDTGPILMSEKIPVLPGDTLESIRDRVGPQQVDLIFKCIKGIDDQSLTPNPQSISDGRQYYIMHPLVKKVAREKLAELLDHG